MNQHSSKALLSSCIAVLMWMAGSGQPVQAAGSMVGVQAATMLAGLDMTGTGSAPPLPTPFTLPSQPIAAGASVGYLPGGGGVSVKGEFTDKIHFDVPAGRAGMQPNLSLVYSSSAGNGAVGVGWALSGLSMIGRCGQTLSIEGVVAGVHATDYSSTPEAERDRLCLDGQKLSRIDDGTAGLSGSYGQSAEYRTVPDSYAQIISVGSSDGSGPGMFTVNTRAGIERTYVPVDAKRWSATATNLQSAGSFHELWVLARERDAAGNGISYRYEDFADGQQGVQHYLKEIDYTSDATGSGAYRKVLFEYEERPDMEFAWQAGREARLIKRLKTITMCAPNPLVSMPVWHYTLEYATSEYSHRSLLTSVQRCANASNGSCAWKQQFSWAGTSVALGKANRIPSFTTKDITDPANPLLANPLGLLGMDAPISATPGNVYSPSGIGPFVQVMDVDNNGTDDVLFQPGVLPWDVTSEAGYANYQSIGAPLPGPAMLLMGDHVNPLVQQTFDLSKNGGGVSAAATDPVYQFQSIRDDQHREFDDTAGAGVWIGHERVRPAGIVCERIRARWTGQLDRPVF